MNLAKVARDYYDSHGWRRVFPWRGAMPPWAECLVEALLPTTPGLAPATIAALLGDFIEPGDWLRLTPAEVSARTVPFGRHALIVEDTLRRVSLALSTHNAAPLLPGRPGDATVLLRCDRRAMPTTIGAARLLARFGLDFDEWSRQVWALSPELGSPDDPELRIEHDKSQAWRAHLGLGDIAFRWCRTLGAVRCGGCPAASGCLSAAQG